MKLGVAILFFVTLAGAIAFSTSLAIANASSSFTESTDIDECYGETLEIQIHMFAPDQPNGGEVIMSLPNPASWTLIARDGRGSLHDAGCQEEPVLVREAYSSGMLNKFRAALGTTDAPNALSNIVSLSLEGSKKNPPETHRYSNYAQATDWSSVSGGFRRLNTADKMFWTRHGRTFVSGVFFYPDHYPRPSGQPMFTDCNTFGYCGIGYFLHDRLHIRYRFISSLQFDEDWIPQDQALRAMIDGWVTDLPIKTED